MAYKKDFNVFVGTKTGILKAIKVNDGGKNIVKRVQNMEGLTTEHEITSMAWGDSEEKEILIGLSNQTVKIYDSDFKAFTRNVDAKCGEGPIVGIVRYDGSLLTGTSSGHVKLWQCSSESVLNTGGAMERLRQSPYNRDLIATGGKANDLKLWNVAAGNKSTFRAKNVPHNSLQLEVPVWVSDIAFLPNSSKIAVCTRYGQVRVYDTSAQRRPVLNIEVPEKALTAIAASSKPDHVVVGCGTGHMFLVDLRYKGLQCGNYKGSTGSIREITCHKSEPYVVSVSLDRHLRVHHANTRQVLHSEYLTSKLNCVLMRSDFDPKEVKAPTPDPVRAGSDTECVQLSDGEGEMNDIFKTMETVCDEEVPPAISKKRTIVITGLKYQKKKKTRAS